MSTTIIGVGNYLTELLVNKYGYNVIHDTSVYDYVDGNLTEARHIHMQKMVLRKYLLTTLR